MPDKFGPYPNMRVREYLDFFGAAFKIPKKERKARIQEVLEITRATYMQDRYVEALSHGMQQRVGIARTLLHDPEVLIFDEPANGLDPEARIEMRDLLLRLADLGKTLIVTSHILPELSRICDEIAIISGGKLRASGTMAEINEQLGQMRMVEIHLDGADRIDQAQEIVRKHSDIAEIAGSKTEELIRFRANLTDQAMANLLNSLVSANVPVAQFHEVQTDLEDAFLTVTKEDRAKMV
jgi:ABC-2 type transport system ATP-binding protein